MFTRNLRIAMLALVILTLAGSAVAQPPIRLAVIDLDRLVAQSVAGKELQGTLEEFQRTVASEGQALTDQANATKKLIDDGANSLSDDRLAELQKQLEDATIAIRRFRDDKQREGNKLQNEGLQQIERKLQPVLDSVQSGGNYDLILNRAVGIVVLASERVDITDQVIQAFDAAEAASLDAPATEGEG